MSKTQQNSIFTDATTQTATQQSQPRGRTQFTFQGPTGESTDKPSQTVPTMGMTISEMLRRQRLGLPINSGSQQPIYNGEKLLPNWKNLDNIDKAALIKNANEQVAHKKAQRDAAYQKAQKSSAEAIAKKQLADKEALTTHIKSVITDK